jgi:Clp amino terminal domain, pathogenicity island component/UvrB/uvrC motif
VLESLNITVEDVRAEVARIIGQGDELTSGQIPFTPRAKKVLELSLREAMSLGHNYIGTEHILLGLVRENQGVAARILLHFDADAETIRNEVLGMLSGPGRPPVAQGSIERARPIPPEVVEAIEEVRREKEAAIAAGDFEGAAKLRGRERKLMRAAGIETHHHVVGDRLTTHSGPSVLEARLSVVLGLVLAAIAFPLGLLIGWLIWG